jgi:hypothetical protein
MFARAARTTPALVRGFASSARADYKVAVLGAAGGIGACIQAARRVDDVSESVERTPRSDSEGWMVVDEKKPT